MGWEAAGRGVGEGKPLLLAKKEPQAELITVYSSSHDQGHCW